MTRNLLPRSLLLPDRAGSIWTSPVRARWKAQSASGLSNREASVSSTLEGVPAISDDLQKLFDGCANVAKKAETHHSRIFTGKPKP
jgi:hypothetical protein